MGCEPALLKITNKLKFSRSNDRLCSDLTSSLSSTNQSDLKILYPSIPQTPFSPALPRHIGLIGNDDSGANRCLPPCSPENDDLIPAHGFKLQSYTEEFQLIGRHLSLRVTQLPTPGQLTRLQPAYVRQNLTRIPSRPLSQSQPCQLCGEQNHAGRERNPPCESSQERWVAWIGAVAGEMRQQRAYTGFSRQGMGRGGRAPWGQGPELNR